MFRPPPRAVPLPCAPDPALPGREALTTAVFAGARSSTVSGRFPAGRRRGVQGVASA